MEFHRLLADAQAPAYLGVRQAFDTAKRHLSFAPAQIVVCHHALDRPLKVLVPFSARHFSRKQCDTHLSAARENFLRTAHEVLFTRLAVSIFPVTLSFDTQLGNQAFQASSQRAQAADVGQRHQLSSAEET